LHPVDNEDETFYPGFGSKQDRGGETRAQMIASKNQNTYSNQKNNGHPQQPVASAGTANGNLNQSTFDQQQ
jgi:hypothetical protein